MKDEKIINGINKVRAEFSLIVYYGVILSILIKMYSILAVDLMILLLSIL